MATSGGDERGQATVEFALVLPLIVVLALAIAQIGAIVRNQLMVIHAAREAARAVSVDGGADVDAVVLGSTDLDPARTSIDVVGPDKTVTVTVTADVPVAVPIVSWAVGEVTVEASVTMVVEGVP